MTVLSQRQCLSLSMQTWGGLLAFDQTHVKVEHTRSKSDKHSQHSCFMDTPRNYIFNK